MARDITEKMTQIQYKALFDKHMNAEPKGFSKSRWNLYKERYKHLALRRGEIFKRCNQVRLMKIKLLESEWPDDVEKWKCKSRQHLNIANRYFYKGGAFDG